jgi:flagellar basal-body rod protein FlgF
MLQSLKVSEAGLIGQEQKVSVLANNLANASTPGFKRMLATHRVDPPPAPGLIGVPARALPPAEPNVLMPGGLLQTVTAVDLSPGPMQPTGNALDVAVDGDGFFVVQTAQGERYTRNGAFSLDGENRLVTQVGEAVLGDGGPIEIPPGALLEIATDGTVRADGSELGRLRLVRPLNGQALTPDGATNFATAPGAGAPQPVPEEARRVAPGFLEGSNTNPISELVAMITAQRVFEAGQRVISTTDETLGKNINEIPRVR